MKFKTPLDFSNFILEKGSVPLSFEISMSSSVARVFYRHFFEDDAARAMLGTIEDLPPEIAKSWQEEYDSFGNALLSGRFQVSVSCYSVLDYFFHYASDFPEGNYVDDVNECLGLFDIESTPPNRAEAQELHDLLVAITIAQPLVNREPTNLVYTGDLPKFMKYVGKSG